MNTQKILILGGYGNTGLSLARLMLRFTNVDLVIAGPRRDVAAAVSRELNHLFGQQRVTG